MPASPQRCGRQTEIDCIATGIEHQENRALLAFLDQTGKLLFLWVKPIGQLLLRAEPADFGIRVEVFLTENRMRRTKGNHAASELEDFFVFFQIAPVIPVRFIILAVRVVVAALRTTE